MVQAPYNVVHYYLVGAQLAQRLFMVNEISGEVSVRRDLATDSNVQYTVRVAHCSDGNT